METKRTNTMIWSLLGATALALFLFAAANDAEAAVRVRAVVKTPYGAVQIASGPSVRYREVVRRPLPIRYVDYRITAQDKQIARRLASFTGASRQELLRLKRQGYSWVEIGDWLDLPRYAVRAAYDGRSWQRFIAAERRADCGGSHLALCCSGDDRGHGRRKGHNHR